MLNDRPCIVNLISSRNTGHPLSLQLPQLGEVFYRDQLTPEAAAKLGPSVDVLVGASNLKVPKSELDLYPNLKMVADFGVGYDGFDTAEIIRRGLRFSHTPDVLSEDTADLGLALLLDVTRRVAQGAATGRRKTFRWDAVFSAKSSALPVSDESGASSLSARRPSAWRWATPHAHPRTSLGSVFPT